MRIELLGTSFSVKTDEDEEYLREVVALFARKVSEVQRNVPTSDPLKISILAGVLLSDEFLKLRGATRGETIEAGRIAESLIGELSEVLDGSEPPGLEPEDPNQSDSTPRDT
jgi:cell division protein ZapA (FtsZ GTPase activity inhibitor)